MHQHDASLSIGCFSSFMERAEMPDLTDLPVSEPLECAELLPILPPGESGG